MPATLSRGATTLAPTPTHPHQLSGEHSREDIEMAENLHLLNRSQDRQTIPRDTEVRQETPGQTQAGSPLTPATNVPEYHSLEDTLHYQQKSLPEQPPTPATTVSNSLPSAVSNAPIAGQVCSNCGTTTTPLWRRSPSGETICNACGLYQKARNQNRPINIRRNVQKPVVPINNGGFSSGQAHDRDTSPSASPRGATFVPAAQVNGTCPGGGRCNGTGGQQGCNGCPAYNNRVAKTAQYALAETHAQKANSVSGASAGEREASSSASVALSAVMACQNCGTTVTPLWRRDEAGHSICNACGLFYKLHGKHRPVTMKKQEIKRRKRVMPATPDNASQAATPGANYSPQQHSVSPDPTASVEQSEYREYQSRGPVAVDFTNYYSRATPPAARTPRKRSLSATMDPEEQQQHRPLPLTTPTSSQIHDSPNMAVQENTPHNPSSISSILNPRPTTSDSMIDPSLSAMSSGAQNVEVANMGRARQAEDKAARKEKLRREAEAMRELLLRKEKELEELD